MSLLVVHHDEIAGLAHLAESLAARDLDVVEVDATTDELPDPSAHDGVLVLGGRQSVAGELDDWVGPELAFLRAADAAEVPVFGICLGSQLLGLAHGGEVAPREEAEKAIVALHRTAPGRADDIVAGWPDGAPGLAHHNDEVVVLPDEAEQLLLGSDGATMWRLRNSYAIQTHPEAGVESLRLWMDAALSEPAPGDDDLLEAAATSDAFMRAAGVSLVMRWVDNLA